jgi:hypothetical protein
MLLLYYTAFLTLCSFVSVSFFVVFVAKTRLPAQSQQVHDKAAS